MGACDNKERKRHIIISEYKSRNNIIEKKTKKVMDDFEFKAVGFINIGNSCYMNSFLQILLHCPNFLYELKGIYQRHSFGNCLIKNIIDLSNSQYPYNKQYLYSIKECMKNISDYGSFIQNDSQDFGKDLINEIIVNIKKKEQDYSSSIYNNESDESEIIDKKTKIDKYQKYINKYQGEETFIEKMFTINECLYIYEEQNITNIIFNTSFDILLNFPKNKNKMYNEEYSLEKLLDLNYNNKNNNYMKKNKKNKKDKILKTTMTKLCKLPKILMISIVRAIFKKDLIKSILYFPEFLDLENYIDKDLLNAHLNKTQYKLFAVNEHEGNDLNSGHYYCHIKIKNDWFLFSDEKVKKSKIKLSSVNVVGLFYKYIDI